MIKFDEFCLRRGLGTQIENVYTLLPYYGINPDAHVNYLYEHPELWDKDPVRVLIEAWYSPNWSGAGKGAASGAAMGAGLGSFIPGVGTAIGAGLGGAAGGLLGGYGGQAAGAAKGIAGKLGGKYTAWKISNLLKNVDEDTLKKNFSPQEVDQIYKMQADAAQQAKKGGFWQGWQSAQQQQMANKLSRIIGKDVSGQQPQQPQQPQQQAQDQWTGPGRLGAQRQQGQYSPQQTQSMHQHLTALSQSLQQAQGNIEALMRSLQGA